MQDSLKLEEVYNLNDSDQETRVATDGGRYDVDIVSRERSPVYWSEDANEVRRCSWFYKGAADSRYTPYEESLAARLEEEYKQGCSTNSWNRKLELGSGEHIILHSSTLQMHYLQPSTPDLGGSWSTPVVGILNGFFYIKIHFITIKIQTIYIITLQMFVFTSSSVNLLIK